MYGWFDWGSLVINIVLFLLLGYGVYLLAKKMHIKNAWMGWVPILQLYTMTQIAGVSFKKYVLYPILILILATFLPFVFVWFFIGWNWDIFSLVKTYWILFLVILLAQLYFLYRYIGILHAISKRTWWWVWTTIWLFFLAPIMFPLIAHGFEGLKEENTKEENKEEIKKEEN